LLLLLLLLFLILMGLAIYAQQGLAPRCAILSISGSSKVSMIGRLVEIA